MAHRWFTSLANWLSTTSFSIRFVQQQRADHPIAFDFSFLTEGPKSRTLGGINPQNHQGFPAVIFNVFEVPYVQRSGHVYHFHQQDRPNS